MCPLILTDRTSIPLAHVTAPDAPESSCKKSVTRRRLSYEHTESIHACEDTGNTDRENILDASRKRKLEEPINFEVPSDCQTESGPVQDEVRECNEDTIKEKSTHVKGDEPNPKVPAKKGIHESENQILLHNEAPNAAVDNIDEVKLCVKFA